MGVSYLGEVREKRQQQAELRDLEERKRIRLLREEEERAAEQRRFEEENRIVATWRAKDLCTSWHENCVAAETAYIGKRIVVWGELD